MTPLLSFPSMCISSIGSKLLKRTFKRNKVYLETCPGKKKNWEGKCTNDNRKRPTSTTSFLSFFYFLKNKKWQTWKKEEEEGKLPNKKNRRDRTRWVDARMCVCQRRGSRAFFFFLKWGNKYRGLWRTRSILFSFSCDSYVGLGYVLAYYRHWKCSESSSSHQACSR
jgi:hypothetical protein